MTAQSLELLIAVEGERARTWRLAWTGINGASTLGPIAVLPFVDRDARADLVVGAIVSAISTASSFFWPLEVEATAPRISELSSLPTCKRFDALRLLAESAAFDEAARRAWPWHALNLGISAALGGFMAFGLGHRTSGVVTGVSGFLVGEAQLFTQPVGLVASASAWNRPLLTFLWDPRERPGNLTARLAWQL